MHICYKCQWQVKKNLTPLLHLLINWISAKSKPQILSIKGDFTFLLINFLIIDLFNSSANSLLEIFSFLNTTLRSFLFFIFYLLCLFHFYKKTKIQNKFKNIILHKKIYEIKERKIYICNYKFSKTNIEATPRSPKYPKRKFSRYYSTTKSY